jgi:hypothetical protein
MKIKLVAILICCTFLCSQSALSQSFDTSFLYLRESIEHAVNKTEQTLVELNFDATKHPAHTDHLTGEWVNYNRDEWTSGYFAGILWYLFKLTGDQKYEGLAREWTEDMKPTAFEALNHDVGLRVYGSFGIGYKVIQDLQYRRMILKGANSLASRFDPTIKAIKSWEPWETLDAHYPVIIDNMMNLQLLFEASRLSGNATLKQIAIEHSKTTLKHHFREDGSTYHIVDFNNDGSVIRKFTIQGYGPNSVWARGQAWAMYGFTMAYGYTNEKEFLNAAISASDYFIGHLPEDFIPWYDFLEPAIPNTTRDVSAATVAASALFELHRYTSNPSYFEAAVNILNAVMSEDYASFNSKESSILKKSTIHRGDFERGTIYADYYFLEAIVRYKELTNITFPSMVLQPNFYLDQNYPNPFNNQTNFYYSIEEGGEIEISVFDITGRKIRTLFQGFQKAGSHIAQFSAEDLTSGIYFYSIRTGDQVQSRKMLLVK